MREDVSVESLTVECHTTVKEEELLNTDEERHATITVAAEGCVESLQAMSIALLQHRMSAVDQLLLSGA